MDHEEVRERDSAALADADLILRTRSGDSDAFAELWRRHYRAGMTVARNMTSSLDADDLVQEAYTRIYRSIVMGGGPTGSFRAYLFTSIRNTAAAWGRARRETAYEELDEIEDPATREDATDAALDRSLTHQAFRSLPTRWQEVLWYSEIEGMKPAEIAPLLAMKPTAVAQLTFRAREGLREAWVQAHLRSVADGSDCQWTIERLGAFARRNTGRRDREKVERHLETCVRCAIVASEAHEVSSRLALVLLPLAVGATGTAGYLATLHGAGAPAVALTAMPASVMHAAVSGAGGSTGTAGVAGTAGFMGASSGGGVGAGAGAAAVAASTSAGAAAAGTATALGAAAGAGVIGASAVAVTAAAGSATAGISAVGLAAAGLIVAGGLVTAATVSPALEPRRDHVEKAFISESVPASPGLGIDKGAGTDGLSRLDARTSPGPADLPTLLDEALGGPSGGRAPGESGRGVADPGAIGTPSDGTGNGQENVPATGNDRIPSGSGTGDQGIPGEAAPAVDAGIGTGAAGHGTPPSGVGDDAGGRNGNGQVADPAAGNGNGNGNGQGAANPSVGNGNGEATNPSNGNGNGNNRGAGNGAGANSSVGNGNGQGTDPGSGNANGNSGNGNGNGTNPPASNGEGANPGAGTENGNGNGSGNGNGHGN